MTVTFSTTAALGATITATATCASGKLLGGGGAVAGNNARHYAALTSSYPSSATTWTVVATILAGSLRAGGAPTVTASVLCGA